MHKTFEEEKTNREQLFEMKLKEILNLDQKFSQAMESEILVYNLKYMFVYHSYRQEKKVKIKF